MSIVLPKIAEILQNAIRVNDLKPKLQTASNTYVLIGIAQEQNGDLHVIRFVVNTFTNTLDDVDVLYAISTKKEPATLLPRSAAQATPTTDPTINIADLLNSVKDYFPEILSVDVLNHFGITQRPAGELGASAKYSRVLNQNAVEYVDLQKNRRRKNPTAVFIILLFSSLCLQCTECSFRRIP